MGDWPATANANIVEIGGTPHYTVRLEWVPRIGDLIDLTSFREIEANKTDASRLRYEVVQVVHRLHDVTQKHLDGHHFVEVLVRPSQSNFFDGGA